MHLAEHVLLKPHTMPARTQNTSQHLLTKKSHASQDTKCISTMCCHSPLMHARNQNASQHAMTKHLTYMLGHKNVEPMPSKRGHYMHLNM